MIEREGRPRTPVTPGTRDDGSRPAVDGTIRVLVADDHPIFREGIAALIGRQPDMVVVGQAGDGRQAVELFAGLAPDVGVLDLRMPVLGGIEAIAAIRAAPLLMKAPSVSAELGICSQALSG